MYRLYCYVREDDYNSVFEVKIGKDESVAALKNVIKEEKKPEFDHVRAASLVLWKASVSINRNLKEDVEALNLIKDNALQSFEILSDILPSELQKGTVHIVVDRPPTLISPLQLVCHVKGERYKHVFEVKIDKEESVSALRDVIREKKKPTFDHIHASYPALWNVKIPRDKHLKEAVDKLGLVDEKSLMPWVTLSKVFPHQPADGHIHIVVDFPTSSRPRWLVEIHRKLWGRRDLFGQIFRTANLTKADFMDLQCQLQEQNPNRNSESYVATDVLATKSAFLRSRCTTDLTSDAPLGGGFGDRLVPRLVQPPSSDVVDDDADDADAVADDTMEIDPDPDADCLSTGTTAIFPCTIQYMDLTVLELENDIRVPQLTFIREEWGTMVDIFNKREKGIKGSAVFTGQPSIGKTCLLYSILIHCIIHAQPIVFQDVKGKVFVIDDTVRRHKGTHISRDDVLTLVDAEGAFCQPNAYLFNACNLRILPTSPPRNRKDRKWLTQIVGETEAVFFMKPWSREELLVASLFLADIDITLKRFQETSDICGLIPGPCFEAAASHDTLRDAADAIVDAIKETKDFHETIIGVRNGATIHRAFQIQLLPSKSRRSYKCLTEVVSDWAFSKLMAHLDQQGADAAYEFYRTIHLLDYSPALCEKMFETKLHLFFRTITVPRTFTIHSLDDYSTTFDIEFSSNTEHHTFGDIQNFAGQLASSVSSNKSCYLMPLSPVFPTLDSFLYQHGMSQSGYPPLIGLQVTTASMHPISIQGLEKVQKSLAHLDDLRPSKDRKLIILFVVPDTMEASFVKQQIKDAERVGHWYEKTCQYVLALPEKEVFQAM